MIAKHFKSLLIAKEALKSGKDPMNYLSTKSVYAANKYKEQAKRFEEKELIKRIQELAQLDVDAKVGKIDLQIGIEKWIAQ